MTELQNDPHLAEAVARRDESRAQILRAKAQRQGGDAINALAKAYGRLAEQAETDARRSAEAIGEIEPAKPDLSGTARTLSDSRGNFAPSPEVANVGGIGVEASNTKAGTDEQAQKPDEVDLSGATQGVGPDGEIGNGDAVDIPADWAELHWKTQVSLASNLSGETDLSAARAREIIEEQEKARAG